MYLLNRLFNTLLSFTLILGCCGIVIAQTRAQYEPDTGCYIGAFIVDNTVMNPTDADVGSVLLFESPTYANKKHATYFTYTGFESPGSQSNFPWQFAMQCKKAGAGMHLGWETNSGWPSYVVDSTYLQSFARDCNLADMPIFLRFDSEMNGNWTTWYSTGSQSSSSTYRAKWQIVYTRLSASAPDAVMVWTPNTPYPGNGADANYNDCYPGDAYTQWVGVDLYDVGYHNSSFSTPDNADPAYDLLYAIYTCYEARKPIKISEWSAVHYINALSYDLSTNVNSPGGIDNYYSPTKLQALYSVVSANFPRLKCIQIFDDNEASNYDYAVTDNDTVNATYASVISSPYFLTGVVPQGIITYNQPQPFGAGPVIISLTTDRPINGAASPLIQIETLGTNTTGYVSMSSTANPLVWQYTYQVQTASAAGINGFTDDFENGTAPNFTLPSTWYINYDVNTTNQVLFTDNSISTCVGGYDWSDYGIRMTIESQNSGNEYMGVIARYANSSSYYFIVLRGDSHQDLRLLKQNGGTSSTLTTISQPLSANTAIIAYYPYEFRVECQDSTIRVRIWRKWEQEPNYWQLVYTDTSPITHGQIGMRTNASYNLYDNIRQMQFLPNIDGEQIVHIDARDRDNSQTYISGGASFVTNTGTVPIPDWTRYQ